MREYKEPEVEVIELPAEDIITTSGSTTGSDTELPQGDLVGGVYGGASGPLTGAKWQ